MKENSYNFFQNSDCPFFPCADIKTNNLEDFSCLMCYCPLYHYDDCGGRFAVLPNGIKDCSNCLIPHYDYDYIINKLIEKNKETISMKANETNISIKIELVHEKAKVPTYSNPDDSGMDVYAVEDVIIAPGKSAIVKTGLKVAIPDGYEIQVRPRSGISLKTPLRVANAPGTIDAGYRDEIGIIIYNEYIGYLHQNESFEEPLDISLKGNIPGSYKIKAGDRIAQLVLQKVPKIDWEIVDSVADIGTNRGGGFGSTGTK